METLTQMQLQKLVYLANGWNLAINGMPLVSDNAEAWDYGPVYRDLYDHTKFFGKEPIGRLITPDDAKMARFFLGSKKGSGAPYSANLDDREKKIIGHVWRRYGSLSAIKLSELTHQKGTPWFRAYTVSGRNSIIENDSSKEHFEDLADRARAAPRA